MILSLYLIDRLITFKLRQFDSFAKSPPRIPHPYHSQSFKGSYTDLVGDYGAVGIGSDYQQK